MSRGSHIREPSGYIINLNYKFLRNSPKVARRAG